MEELIKLSDIVFLDTNTTVLYTSSFNYLKNAVELINKNCVVIDKSNPASIEDIPKSILKEFNCDYLTNKKDLTKIDDIKINILASLNSSKEIFVFLNVLTFTDKDFKEKVIDYLIKKNKRIINYTTEIEETLLLDYIIVIHEDKVIMEGLKLQVLSEEKILKKLGFNLPFIIELSQGLMYYNLVDEIYLEKESLVDDLWK